MSRVTTDVGAAATPPALSVAYTLRIDPSHLDIVDVAIRLNHAPRSLRLAMKVHPEYDAKYWRHLDSARVEASADDGTQEVAAATRARR